MGSLIPILVLGYLLGSVSSSVLVVRLHSGIDLRRYGSGNAGATNVVRVAGWGPGVLVGLFDVAKGFAASAWIARLRIGGEPATGEEVTALLAGLAAVIGHVWPVFAGFRGGKGVATAAGAMLAVRPVALLVCLPVVLAVLLATRWVSLASLFGAALLPGAVWLAGVLARDPVPAAALWIVALLSALLVLAHRSNIARLLGGTEPRFGSAGEARPR